MGVDYRLIGGNEAFDFRAENEVVRFMSEDMNFQPVDICNRWSKEEFVALTGEVGEKVYEWARGKVVRLCHDWEGNDDYWKYPITGRE